MGYLVVYSIISGKQAHFSFDVTSAMEKVCLVMITSLFAFTIHAQKRTQGKIYNYLRLLTVLKSHLVFQDLSCPAKAIHNLLLLVRHTT